MSKSDPPTQNGFGSIGAANDKLTAGITQPTGAQAVASSGGAGRAAGVVAGYRGPGAGVAASSAGRLLAVARCRPCTAGEVAGTDLPRLRRGDHDDRERALRGEARVAGGGRA